MSEFGRAVLGRFSSVDERTHKVSINMFDVRIGAYSVVWRNLGGMLSGALRYDKDLHRQGQYAEQGVAKLARNFWSALRAEVDELAGGSVLEVGLTTGLLERLALSDPRRSLYGLDRSHEVIECNAASAQSKGITNVEWLHADFFATDCWCPLVCERGHGLIYSLHFHELLALGERRFIDLLRTLRAALPNWVLVAFEQPRMHHSDRKSMPEAQWLYCQSNVLIHHLIGNGRILTSAQWLQLGQQAGCKEVSQQPCGYLGYSAFKYRL